LALDLKLKSFIALKKKPLGPTFNQGDHMEDSLPSPKPLVLLAADDEDFILIISLSLEHVGFAHFTRLQRISVKWITQSPSITLALCSLCPFQ
jgi:hypothetical protein